MKRKMDEITSEKGKELVAIEFFSGIGGWSSALRSCPFPCRVIQAFDINTAANEVYQANFELQPSGKSILNLQDHTLDKTGAQLWMMSPPCQPFTRNNQTDHRDLTDNRSEPFLHLIQILFSMKNPPTYIALENVIGFESSACCHQFLDVLDERGYSFRQFHLDPLKIGVPNSRPRYYCIAQLSDKIVEEKKRNSSEEDEIIVNSRVAENESHLTLETPIVQKNLRFYLDEDVSSLEMDIYKLKNEVLQSKAGWCLDIQSPSSVYSSCFTKSYSRYCKGTGSVLLCSDLDRSENNDGKGKDGAFEDFKGFPLLETEIADRQFDPNWWQNIQQQYPDQHLTLRYFKPIELLRLFGFHSDFKFPENISLKKQYELIGNSVNVTIISILLKELIIQGIK